MAQRTLRQLAGGSALNTVSIIGSAGRRGDAARMTKDLYWKMVEKAEFVILNELKLESGCVHLVSGGAAWADHVAVTLYLENKVAALTLHIPAAWKSKANEVRFEDNGKPSQSNPGKVANKLHKTFSEKINEETLMQIETCRHLGAWLEVHDGFKKRNDSVAKSQYLIAFSWGDGEAPSKGGTLDTWSKCAGKKLHIPLSSLEQLTKPTTHQDPCSSVEVHGMQTSCGDHSTPEVLNSSEVCSAVATTHAEPYQSQNLSQSTSSSVSEEMTASCSTAASCPPAPSEYTSEGSESLDSGLGSFESLMSVERTQTQHKCSEGQNKRKRSESADILDNSDIECDDIKVKHTVKCLSKRPKLSDFAKHALNCKK